MAVRCYCRVKKTYMCVCVDAATRVCYPLRVYDNVAVRCCRIVPDDLCVCMWLYGGEMLLSIVGV